MFFRRILPQIAWFLFASAALADPRIDSVRITRCENLLIDVLTLRTPLERLDLQFSEPIRLGTDPLAPVKEKRIVRGLLRQVVKNEGFASWVTRQFREVTSVDAPGDVAGLFVDQARYTFVIAEQRVSFARTANDVISNLLSKHLLLAAGEPTVQYAGEFVLDFAEKIITLDNASGTYLPNLKMLRAAAGFFAELFPDFRIRVAEKNSVGYRDTVTRFLEKLEFELTGGPSMRLEDRIDRLTTGELRHQLMELNEYLGNASALSAANARARALVAEFEISFGLYRLSVDLLRDALTIGMDPAAIARLVDQADSDREAFRTFLILRGWVDPERTPLRTIRKSLPELAPNQIREFARFGRRMGEAIDGIAGEDGARLTTESRIHGFRRRLRRLLTLIGAERGNVSFAMPAAIARTVPRGFDAVQVAASKYGIEGASAGAYFAIERADHEAIIHWVQELGNFKDQLEVSRLLAKRLGGRVSATEIQRRMAARGIYASPYGSAEEVFREIESSGVLGRLRSAFRAPR